MTGYREPPVPPLKYDTDTLARMQELWEHAPELSAVKIAARFNVTKNTVIGQAHRREWKPRRERTTEPTAMQDRLDALDVFPPTGRCVFPIEHPKSEGFRFCCDLVTDIGAPYCASHEAKCRPSALSLARMQEWEAAGPERHSKAAAHVRALGGNKVQRGVA